jgi:hypothetical protein
MRLEIHSRRLLRPAAQHVNKGETMKAVLVMLSLIVSSNVFATSVNLDCSGDAVTDGKPATFFVKLNEQALLIGSSAKDGSGAELLKERVERVEYWREGSIQALGKAEGLKVYLMGNNHAILYRLQGWGTNNPDGELVALTCK